MIEDSVNYESCSILNRNHRKFRVGESREDIFVCNSDILDNTGDYWLIERVDFCIDLTRALGPSCPIRCYIRVVIITLVLCVWNINCDLEIIYLEFEVITGRLTCAGSSRFCTIIFGNSRMTDPTRRSFSTVPLSSVLRISPTAQNNDRFLHQLQTCQRLLRVLQGRTLSGYVFTLGAFWAILGERN